MMAGTWLYYPLFLFFPGMDRMNPTRITFLFTFTFAAAAGLGWTALGSLRGRRRILFLGVSGLLLAAILGLGLFGGTPEATRIFDAEIAAAGLPEAKDLLDTARNLRRPSSPFVYPQMIFAGLAAAAVAIRVLVVRPALARPLFLLLFSLLGYEMISFGWGYNSFTKPEDVFSPTPAIGFLRRQPGPFRVTQDAASGFTSNTMAPFGIQELGGYSSFYPDRTKKFMSSIEFSEMADRAGPDFDRWVHFTMGSHLMDLANVRYLLTVRDLGPSVVGASRVYEGEISVYEFATAMPRAFMAHRAVVRRGEEALAYMNSRSFDMRGEVVLEEEPSPRFLDPGAAGEGFASSARITVYSNDRVEVLTDSATNGYLVMSDAWYPGWRARVDGAEVPIIRADYLFRGIPLTAGKHRVVFQYLPRAFRYGLLISIAGAALVAAGIALTRGKGKMPAPGRS
jgi:hypothetical protein